MTKIKIRTNIIFVMHFFCPFFLGRESCCLTCILRYTIKYLNQQVTTQHAHPRTRARVSPAHAGSEQSCSTLAEGWYPPFSFSCFKEKLSVMRKWKSQGELLIKKKGKAQECNSCMHTQHLATEWRVCETEVAKNNKCFWKIFCQQVKEWALKLQVLFCFVLLG